jgi:GTP-binding protein
MRILNAEFVKSIGLTGEIEDDYMPEICFMGRSNVGKSSMINSLVMQKIARTSSTPGATRTINIFKVYYESQGEKKYVIFSDFPGFGFAKVSKAMSHSWKTMMERYVSNNKRIKKLIWLFDVRREIDYLDEMVMEWIFNNKLEFCLVLTKSDKEKQGDLARKKRFFNNYFKGNPVFLYSSKTGQGKKELLSYLMSAIE